MCQKRLILIILVLLFVLIASGCSFTVHMATDGTSGVSKFINSSASDENEDIYLPGEWSTEVFSRNGCYSYSMVLDSPLEGCKGFTVDYQVTEIDGRMKTNSKFQIFYRTLNGNWEKGTTFYLDDWSASVQQFISTPVTVTEVTVLCLNAGSFSWSATMGVKNPVY